MKRLCGICKSAGLVLINQAQKVKFIPIDVLEKCDKKAYKKYSKKYACHYSGIS
jgi:hypothetical protein